MAGRIFRSDLPITVLRVSRIYVRYVRVAYIHLSVLGSAYDMESAQLRELAYCNPRSPIFFC